MPLHLLGKKSWNVYNPASIARVKADEAAAAAREADEEQRMQELDAARRAAILRGETPPPLVEEPAKPDRTRRDSTGHDRKRRRLAGEDDTDRDIRLARDTTTPKHENNAMVLKLRKPGDDAPLTDYAGNINLFPVDLKEIGKREKNAEVEREKEKMERALGDQYAMRLSNAAGKEGLKRPWYAASSSRSLPEIGAPSDQDSEHPGFESNDVWGNNDPRRKERQQSRISAADPFAIMQRAQVQLKRSKEDKKQWVNEREKELMGPRAAENGEHRRAKVHERRRPTEDNNAEHYSASDKVHSRDRSSKLERNHRSRSPGHERRREGRSSHRGERRHHRSRIRSQDNRHQRELPRHHNQDVSSSEIERNHERKGKAQREYVDKLHSRRDFMH